MAKSKGKTKTDIVYFRLGQRRPAVLRVMRAEKRRTISDTLQLLLDEALVTRQDSGRAA